MFTNLLLADEINRASPKTQSALLEAMEERQVTVDGDAAPLPDPFMVIATQNPVEYEGTYPLPEAQLDRFLLKLVLPAPQRDQEIEVLRRHAAGRSTRAIWPPRACAPVPTPAGTGPGARRGRQPSRCSDEVLGYVVDLVRATRTSPSLSLGVSRAGSTALLATAGRGRGSPGATTSPPTTSRRWPARRCGTGCSCAPRPSWRASPPDGVLDSVLATVPGPR